MLSNPDFQLPPPTDDLPQPLDNVVDLRPTLGQIMSFIVPELLRLAFPPLFCRPKYYVGTPSSSHLMTTVSVPFKVPTAQLQTLRDRSRAQDTTVQGSLGAASIFAAYACGGAAAGLPITVEGPINLRHLAHPAIPLGIDTLGLYLTSHKFSHGPCLSSKFWDVARAYKRSMTESLADDIATLGQLVLLRGDWKKTLSKRADMMPCGRKCTVEISNLGSFSLDGVKWRLTDCEFINGCHYEGPLYMVTVVTVDGVLYGSVGGTTPCTSEAANRQFAELAMGALEMAASGDMAVREFALSTANM